LVSPFAHGAADTEHIYEIDARQIGKFLDQSQTFETFYQKVRSNIVGFLSENGYSRFDDQPYKEGDIVIKVQS
jgi:hypothetical protein